MGSYRVLALALALALALPLSCGEPPKDGTSPSGSAAQTPPTQTSLPSPRATSTESSAKPEGAAKSEAGPEAESIRQALRSVASQPASVRQELAGKALADLTKGRLLEPLRKAFDELGQSPPEMRRLGFMRALSTPDVARAWAKVCAAGPRALAEVATLARSEQSRHLWKTCKLSGDGLVTEAEAAGTDVTALAAALIASSELGKAELEREVLIFFLKASPAGP